MNRKGAIIATVLTSLLCGVPGLISICVGVITVFGTQSSLTSPSGSTAMDSLVTLFLFVVSGLVLIAIPIVVGFLTLRRKRAQAAAPAPAATDQAPAGPVSQPAAQPADPPAPAEGRDPGLEQVYNRLLALNRPSAPYRIVDGKSEGVDLIAEWKIVDAQWYEIFAKANLTKVFRIYMKLDPQKRQVRAMDREYTLEWKAGVPSLSLAASTFRGQQTSISFGSGYAFTETLAPGQVYQYKFNTNELKKPIQQAVAASGWSYKGIAFGKL
jgi:hypothetical protein